MRNLVFGNPEKTSKKKNLSEARAAYKAAKKKRQAKAKRDMANRSRAKMFSTRRAK